MSPTTVGAIWAQAHDGVIGDGTTIPWHIPEDMAHFREITRGHPVVMGRRTWDSLPERFRPLPGRRNIVVTRDRSWHADGADTAGSVEDALALVDGEVWVIGGGEIYRAALPFTTRLEVTEIDLSVEGETRAPHIPDGWAATLGEWRVSEKSGHRFRWNQYGKAYRTT
ncbi:dihydrofolate reductase [Rhodococcus sp. 14-2470-1a]|uniref:dihydrofolate reductase n=1 Tax=Rhodococcus sp. 14-2470-1a TaxID=2023150 RepID=UPI000B9AF1C2|nr:MULTISPECIES: dihydrofolate reductase [unclassified Rhodococcus (in: high G+C Gram-positive bacteria)]OZD73514.1 dihydrofolate reductase [Rhodococcus sp. 06-1059B-a]OZF56669.1 dihydrofolate reductase [Rhodococcus sp. 14-2470-1a]